MLQPLGQRADDRAQALEIGRPDIDELVDAVRTKLARGDRTDTPQGINRQPLQEMFDPLRRDDRQAVRLLPA